MSEILLDVQELTHCFDLGKGSEVRALDGLSFHLHRGEILGLVGESGCGKSTAARCIMNIYRPSSGKIIYNGIDLCDPKQLKKNKKYLQTSRQLIFQDSSSSLNGQMKVSDIICEPMKINKIKPAHGSLIREAEFQLNYVGLDSACLEMYPHELSGGMRQRVAIARALTMRPELLAADEPIASLDVSVQAQIINLFKHLRSEHGVSILFIAHDLSVVKYLCDRVAVMYRGRLVETAPSQELFESPRHSYTKALISAVPIPDPRLERAKKPIVFDPSSFCRDAEFIEISPEHFVLREAKK